MNLSIATLAPVGILALGGLILIWWLTRRLPGVLRVLLRVVAIPALLVAVGFVVVTMNRSTSFGVPETETIIVPSERMTAQNGTLTVTLNATGSLTAADEETLAFDLSAPITDVSVAVGDTVKAGDVLAQVDTASIDTQIQNAQFSLTEAQNSLTALNAPPTELDIKIAEAQVQAATASLSSASLSGASEQDIEIARLNVELAKNSLWQAQVNRDASESRPGAGYEMNAYANDIEQANQLANSDNSVTTANLNYQATVNDGPDAASLASGNASLMSAQANLDSLLAGPSTTDVRQAEIKVETAQLSLDAAQQSLEQATLVAPFDGVVAAVNLVEGTMPSSGSITLVNTGGYSITLSVDEKDITQLAVGQAVSLEVSALADASLSGHVTHIDPAPVSSESGQLVTYNIEVTLDASDEPLRPGMSAIATVTLNQIDDVIVVPNRFITVDAVTQAATVKVETAAGEYEDIPVTLGTRTDSESEVVSGLNVGQTLVILPTASEAGGQAGFGLFPGGGVPGAGGGNFPGGGAGGPPAGFTGGGNGGGRPGG